MPDFYEQWLLEHPGDGLGAMAYHSKMRFLWLDAKLAVHCTECNERLPYGKEEAGRRSRVKGENVFCSKKCSNRFHVRKHREKALDEPGAEGYNETVEE